MKLPHMILKVYSRVFTEDLDSTLRVLQPLIGRGPELRVKFKDMEVATLDGFCFLAGPKESIKPYLGAVGPVIVDNLEQMQQALEQSGARITQPITAGPTGRNIFSRDAGGVVTEWVQWNPEIWEQINAASNNSGNQKSSPASEAPSGENLLPAGFTEAMAEVNGIQMHYVIGGTGKPLVLVHGWPQTWYEWRHIMPKLAAHFTVIAPDLRGAGGSSKPAPSAGYDSRTMAEDIHELMKDLDFEKIRILGHDIGLLVAYAYAAAYPSEVERLIILDGLLVGIEPMWSDFLKNPKSWVFGIAETPELPEQLTAGREREYMSWFFRNIAYNPNAIGEDETAVYVQAYSAPGAMSAGFEWFRAFPKDIEFNTDTSRPKLSMPVLTLGGETTMGRYMLPMIQTVAENVRGGSIPECGHWIAEERPDYLVAKLLDFLP